MLVEQRHSCISPSVLGVWANVLVSSGQHTDLVINYTTDSGVHCEGRLKGIYTFIWELTQLEGISISHAIYSV